MFKLSVSIVNDSAAAPNLMNHFGERYDEDWPEDEYYDDGSWYEDETYCDEC